jgi:hypothetical protein
MYGYTVHVKRYLSWHVAQQQADYAVPPQAFTAVSILADD